MKILVRGLVGVLIWPLGTWWLLRHFHAPLLVQALVISMVSVLWLAAGAGTGGSGETQQSVRSSSQSQSQSSSDEAVLAAAVHVPPSPLPSAVKPTPIPTLPPSPTAIPSIVNDGNWAYEILGVEGYRSISGSPAAGLFVLVHLGIGNNGRQTSSVNSWNFELEDSKGRRYEVANSDPKSILFSVTYAASADRNWVHFDSRIPPGTAVETGLVFDVAKDAEGLSLMVGQNWFGGAGKRILLPPTTVGVSGTGGASPAPTSNSSGAVPNSQTGFPPTATPCPSPSDLNPGAPAGGAIIQTCTAQIKGLRQAKYFGDNYFLGQFVNISSASVGGDVTAKFWKNGVVVRDVSESVTGYVEVSPGAARAFRISLPKDGWDRYELSTKLSSFIQYRTYAGLDVASQDLVKSSGSMSIKGVARNGASKLVDSAKVVLTAYDALGSIVCADDDSVVAKKLAPGESSAFEMRAPNYCQWGDVAKYEVAVFAH